MGFDYYCTCTILLQNHAELLVHMTIHPRITRPYDIPPIHAYPSPSVRIAKDSSSTILKRLPALRPTKEKHAHAAADADDDNDDDAHVSSCHSHIFSFSCCCCCCCFAGKLMVRDMVIFLQQQQVFATQACSRQTLSQSYPKSHLTPLPLSRNNQAAQQQHP